MDLLFIIGRTIDVVGKLLIAYTAIRIHHRFWKEHKVDNAVFSEMKKEQGVAIAGAILIVIGYALEVISIANG